MKNFGEPYGTQGGWNHIGSKWSVNITDLLKMKKKKLCENFGEP